MTKRKGFTFVEVMFGISIVGIISAMVIPIFYNTYANKVKGTQLKKACAQISYAIDAITVRKSKLTPFEIKRVIYAIQNDNPDIFWIASIGLSKETFKENHIFIDLFF